MSSPDLNYISVFLAEAEIKKFRKEVIHPHLRVGIPCYDLSLIAGFGLVPNKWDFSHPQLCCLDGR